MTQCLHSKAETCEIRQRATFLCYAYQLVLEKMNDWLWHDCCKEACKLLNTFGMKQATFYKIIAKWNILLRKFKAFPHPNLYIQCVKRPLPRLLKVHLFAKEQIVAFSINNLLHLSIEAVYQFIHSVIIPGLAALWKSESANEGTSIAAATIASSSPSTSTSTSTSTINPTSSVADDNQDDGTIELFLHAHRLKNMSFTTSWRWMRLLGFKYDTQKKSLYVDGHEREDIVAH
jgi:hypothetical protein